MATSDTRPTLRRVIPGEFAQAYDLLETTFAAEELNTRQQMLADLARSAGSGSDEEFVMLAGWAEASPGSTRQTLVSLIVGCYLGFNIPDFAGQSIGFIEYLVTNAEFRRQGHASAALTAFEKEMQRLARARHDHLRLVLGEVEVDLVAFKRKRGYRQPLNSRYYQPPIGFEAQTGRPLTAALPKVLVVNAWNQPVEERLLLEAVQLIFAKRYVPRPNTDAEAQHAAAYIQQCAYAPFAASLETEAGVVRMA